MQRIDENCLTRALLLAPGWARVGLSAPTDWMREEAALELARRLLETDPQEPPVGQPSLPL